MIITSPLTFSALFILSYSKLSASIFIPVFDVIIPLSVPFIFFPFSKISILETLNVNCSAENADPQKIIKNKKVIILFCIYISQEISVNY